MNLINKFIIFFVSFLPLINWLGFYEEPKVYIFLIAGFVLSVYFLRRLSSLNLSSADKLFFLWLLILSLSSFFGIHPMESFLGGSYRHQGVVFFIAVWTLGIFIRNLSLSARKILSRTICIGLFIQLILISYEYISGKLYFGRPLGSIGEPNAIAGYLILGFYFLELSFRKIILVINFIGILLTASRIGILISIATVSGYMLNFKNKSTFIFAILIIVLGLSAIPLSTRYESYNEDRLKYLKYGWEAFMEKPFLGYGAESGEEIYNRMYLRRNIVLTPLIIDRSHNLFLDILHWSGVFGVSLFLMWLVEMLRSIDYRKKLTVISFLIFAMFQPLSVVHWVLLVTLLNI